MQIYTFSGDFSSCLHTFSGDFYQLVYTFSGDFCFLHPQIVVTREEFILTKRVFTHSVRMGAKVCGNGQIGPEAI